MTTADISATRHSTESGNMDKGDTYVPANHVEDITTGENMDRKLTNESGQVFFTEEEAARVKRKIDFIILPLLCGCYIFSVSHFCILTTDQC